MLAASTWLHRSDASLACWESMVAGKTENRLVLMSFLLSSLYFTWKRNRSTDVYPTTPGAPSEQSVCADVTSLRSSEASLAWAVSKVSGSRWNSAEERSFFREALYFSWSARERRQLSGFKKQQGEAAKRRCASALPRSGVQKLLWHAASPESQAWWNTGTLPSFPACTSSATFGTLTAGGRTLNERALRNVPLRHSAPQKRVERIASPWFQAADGRRSERGSLNLPACT